MIIFESVENAVGTLEAFTQQANAVIVDAVSQEAARWMESEGATNAATAAFEVVVNLVNRLNDVQVSFEELLGQFEEALHE